MAVEHAADGPSLVDVLDRVLDKGIVIDAWARVSLVGIDMITIESRVMVASFDTYLRYSEPLRHLPVVAGPRGIVDDGSSFSSSRPDDEPRQRPSERPPPRPRTRK
jgi:gas vesicle structural protein